MVARSRQQPKARTWAIALLVAACGTGSGGSDRAPEPAAGPTTVPEAGPEIPAELQRFFTAEDFAPLVEPAPGDWLAEFDERGQTFVEWMVGTRNKLGKRRRVLVIQPIGDLGPHAPPLPLLAEFAGLYFGMEVRVAEPVAVDEIGATRRINPGSGHPQLLAPEILTWLERELPRDAYAVIGLTAVDLYPEESWNFIFGLGSFAERVGVYSLARYHPSFYGEKATADTDRLVLRRTLKVMAHELGHMFGIHHCTYFDCTMNGSNSLSEADRRSLFLCPVDLRKLWHATHFDLRQRYRRLSAFYHRHGLGLEANWTWARSGVGKRYVAPPWSSSPSDPR